MVAFEDPPLREKHALRQWCRSVRSMLPIEEISRDIQSRLSDWPLFRQAQVMLTYRAKPGELDIQPLVMSCKDKTWFLPRVHSSDEITFHRFQAGDALIKNTMGIEEPLPTAPRLIHPGEVDLVLLPGLVYDISGHRLGYGKGYYDRYIHACKALDPGFSSKLAGVVADELLFRECLPVSGWDEPVSFLVTQSRILTCIPASDLDCR